MNQSVLQGTPPWEQPFWKPARGQAATFAFLVLTHLLALVGLILYPVPSIPVLSWAVLFAVLGGLGTTVVYHRFLAHRTFKLHPAVEHFLIFWAMFNGSGAPASWVAYHRLHHSRSDTPEDVSSPRHGGFWWAHLRWLYQLPPADTQKWCPDMKRPGYAFWTRAQAPLILGSFLCGLPFGWQGFFWIGAIRLLYSLHMQCFVNSLMHLDHAREDDSSKNIWWLGPFQLAAWGENWHRNHHSAAASARIGWHWWQVDIGWYFIRTMETLGLATNVKRPRLEQP
jgi:fatty-acid desaturase